MFAKSNRKVTNACGWCFNEILGRLDELFA